LADHPIRRLESREARVHLDALAAVLVDCVAGGASVGYLAPFGLADGRRAFQGFVDEVEARRRILLAAFGGDELVGTVQLVTGLPPNQPHRAEVAKLLVLRSARGRGVGQALMEAAEAEARAAGKTLLMLDTTAASAADRLYRRLGWTPFGTVPGHALMPDGSSSDTTFFWKELGD
jgi:GNAT superfamily N-acetyltransferase